MHQARRRREVVYMGKKGRQAGARAEDYHEVRLMMM
jgi:hypothetical protein